MKRYIYTIIFSLLLVSSCNLDRTPRGTIGSGNGIESVSDVTNFDNMLYIRLRGLYAGDFIYNNEITTDLFDPSIDYSNRGGTYYKWEWSTQDAYATNLWAHCYYTNALCNYILEGINKLESASDVSDSDKAILAVYKGDAYFMRAISMFVLTKRFAPVYNPSTASSDLGVMIQETYIPTSDQSKYPARSSMEATYKFINDNLDSAETLLAGQTGNVASTTFTIDVVKALRSRVYLNMQDYDNAIKYSTELVDAGNYPLISDLTDFNKLWTNDSGNECIMQLWADYTSSSLPASCDYRYLGDTSDGLYTPDWIPAQWVIDLYSSTDIRYKCWFVSKDLTYTNNVKGSAFLLNKFPGNPELQSPTQTYSSHINKIKPFRIAEQYLIAAEAYARKGGNDAAAIKYLKDLNTKRDPSYNISDNLSGEALLNEVKTSRLKELIGEGFRFTDLKRWGDGFTRTKAQDESIIASPATDLTISSDNFRFLLPIPQDEIDANPQIKNQQNPGYQNVEE
ncbi:MAG: RagB/SusD family nutrient uptake outer membrane protein [Bacteroidales bacterium]|jgi:hypothetical protein|nr:RagB/SusD family nutrient uptake outer membrane protein [Bacteroidales bacterium]